MRPLSERFRACLRPTGTLSTRRPVSTRPVRSRVLLPKLGIDASDVVSFGDGQNDKSMIEWAGTGVAMGNAVDEVKAVAQMVTANNNEDGIAVALDKLLG